MTKKTTRMNAGEGLEQDKTDWKKIDALKEEDIDCGDIPDYGAEFWKTAAVVHPSENIVNTYERKEHE